MAKLNIAVIGAGPSGLVTIKELLDEGHQVCCYEKSDRIGGVFSSTHSAQAASIYQDLHLTTSNYFMAFSSFPPKHHEDRHFWSAVTYQNYLYDFIDNFSLEKNIQFNTEIVNIKIDNDGKVMITGQNKESGFVEKFDAVAVCTGVNRKPNIPKFEQESVFQGEIIHANQYRDNQMFRGKNVICVGIGETASDITHSPYALKVA